MVTTPTVSFSRGVVMLSSPVVVEATPDYSTGDLVGGKLTLNSPTALPSLFFASGGLVQSVVITDLAGVSVAKDVFFFSADPAATTFTENGAFAVADADLPNLIGVASVSTWFALSASSVGQALNLALPFVVTADPVVLYAAIVERGTANYAGTSDLNIRVGILPA